MQRREFIALIGGVVVSWPLGAHAQKPIGQAAKMPRLGMLMPGDSGPSGVDHEPFYRGLRELDYIEGKNIAIERRYAHSNVERLPVLAAELVKLKPDIIVAWSTPAALAARQVTNTIPIVAALMADPVNDGLVATLARPGGNITGTTFLGPKLVGKRLQLLRDVVPNLSHVSALWQPHAYGERTMGGILDEIKDAARSLGMQIQLVPAEGPNDLDNAFSIITKDRPDALILLPSAMLFGQYKRILTFVANDRLPAIYQAREFADAGGLMSYGANLNDLFQLSASYVDKILNGAKPSNLPVQQPTKFELVVNMKTAKELGLTVSPQFLQLADEVID
jgi:putative tryptophan/tyrosine transport system substrate-binding protein